ncbi:hypothetical protein [Bradyrhizobium sp. dw_411]|uniref:hypothetical protein n=1 Tax=Bradyrhizobium sp. dw_411 TaxID=2720082 RepID=UPI001BCE2004|nr:hypothetical protein [Bradyrhizobium sp. dw_411]
MDKLPDSLSIALWLVGSLWIVGFIAFLGDAPGSLVAATFVAGLVAGGFEWWVATRRAGQ